MGGYQAYENVFLRSKEFDIGSMNGMWLAIVNNTSIGSKTFIQGQTNYVRGNKVYATTDTQAIAQCYFCAPMVLLDNVFAGKPGASGLVVDCGTSTLAVGNTFTVADWPLRPKPSALLKALPNALGNDARAEFYDAGCNDPNAPPHPSYPCAFQWNNPQTARKTAVAYTLTSGSDAAKDPRDFRLLGADYPGGPWTVLDAQTQVIFAGRREQKTFPIAAPAAFSVYRLEITANASGTPGMRVGKYALLDQQGSNLVQAPYLPDDHAQRGMGHL